MKVGYSPDETTKSFAIAIVIFDIKDNQPNHYEHNFNGHSQVAKAMFI